MYEAIQYEKTESRIVRITLNRPEARNAQSYQMLHELNDAFDTAANDDDISVIVLAANGPHFSSGHDLRASDGLQVLARQKVVGTWSGFTQEGAAGRTAIEKEVYLGFSERWRNIPKPTIAEVQGAVIAGGLMLAWPCDLIVASEDAYFVDNTVSMGVAGAEYFSHPWEMSARKAKEMLFTSQAISAGEALRIGMVNHVVKIHDLRSFTMELAAKIAKQPLFALRLVKESVNGAQDAQGRTAAMQTAFIAHQLSHAHNTLRFGSILDPGFKRPGSEKAIKSK
jgi:enoyl-CoA hydratase